METFLEILKFTIPSMIMLFGVYLIINKIYKQEDDRRKFELYKLNKDVVLPVRLRAYERIALFLQRTTPESILTRFDFNGLTVLQLQQMLHHAVRDEFEHNVSQQIYISKECWALVLTAKESIIQLINTCAAQLKPEDDAMALAQMLLNTYAANDNTPTEIAMNRLTQEIKQFG